MKRWFVASIAVGLMFSVAYWLCFNLKHSSAFQPMESDERLLVSNYTGDHLSYPEATRCAVWDIRVKEAIMTDLFKNPAFVYKTYLHQYGDILVERLNSFWSRQMLYEEIKDDAIIGTLNLSPNELNNVFGGAFLYSEEVLGINVTAPFAHEAALSLSNDELIYARDKMFALYAALLDDPIFYDDLPVQLIRKSSQIEEGLSEQKLVSDVLQADASLGYDLHFPKKMMLLFFVFGMAFVEMIAFFLAVRDDRVKSVKELMHRTDLVMLEETSEAQIDAYRQQSNIQESYEDCGTVYLYTGAMSADLTEKMLTYIREKYLLNKLVVFDPNTRAKHHGVSDEGGRIIVPITLMKTTYGQLAEIANELNRYSMEVQAIVLQK